MMKTIAIIGAGQLGSRHLQGLKIVDFYVKIEVVDPSDVSLALARERYDQIPENSHVSEIYYLKSIKELSEELDLVIIATSAASRFEITKELIKLKRIKNILFEKVLFQRVEEYIEVEKILTNNQINAWVNCPRRMFGFYNELKNQFSDSKQLIFNVSGGDWGIGCNSIHFIDCLAFMSDDNQFTINVSNLDRIVYPSKRVGYKEFSGVITAVTKRGDIMTLISQKDSISPTIITIQNSILTVIIDETNGMLHRLENGEWTTEEIQIQFQSQLTGITAKQILIYGKTQLTTFTESKLLHLSFIAPLIEFYNDINQSDSEICPIT